MDERPRSEERTRNRRSSDISRREVFRNATGTGDGAADGSWHRQLARSRRSILGGLAAATTTLLTGLGIGSTAATVDAPQETDPCTGPAPDPEPGTPDWYARDRTNAYCAQQGQQDFATNPAIETENAATWLERIRNEPGALHSYHGDPYRALDSRWDGERGRYREIEFTDSSGETVPGAIFLPRADCIAGDDADCPEDLPRHSGPPYPGIQLGYHLSERTGTADLLLWAAQGLAEHGYMVYTPAVSGQDEVTEALEFFTSTPADDTDVYNPLWERLDRDRIGLAGYSGAASDALGVGHTDDRVSAIVSWDRSRDFEYPPEPTTPTLLLTSDYPSNTPPPGMTTFPVREREQEPADDRRLQDFGKLRDAGADVMQLVARATHHYGFMRFPAGCGHCSRHGLRVHFYYSLAWFDYHLSHPRQRDRRTDALGRLTTLDRFDDSADKSAIGMGRYDPEAQVEAGGDPAAGNQPVLIEGLPVRDRLSFYWPSRYSIGGHECLDMRDGECPQPAHVTAPNNDGR